MVLTESTCHFTYKSMVVIRHEHNIICNGITHAQTLFVGSYLLVTWWDLDQWKGRQNASNDKLIYLPSLCFTGM